MLPCPAIATSVASHGAGELETALERAEREAWSGEPSGSPDAGARSGDEAPADAAGVSVAAGTGRGAAGDRKGCSGAPEVLRSADDVRGNGDGMYTLLRIPAPQGCAA